MATNINELAPGFRLPDLQGKLHRPDDYRGRIVIINFWSCECPHSERADNLMMKWLSKWNGEAELLSIAANQNESTQSLEKAAKARNLPVVLMDARHVVADLYEAVTTPHVFVVDRIGILRYRGAVDDVRFRHRKATRFYLEEAVDSLLNGNLPLLTECPAYGCAIVREI
jgi:peroxiredoxin